MQFIASVTRSPYQIKKLLRLWKDSGDHRNPFSRVLVTPLFTKPQTLELLQTLKQDGIVDQVYFDSGGYFVQMGRIEYYEMYWQLLKFYQENGWADWYVLPDYVPSSSDTLDRVWFKVKETAQLSSQFYVEMPASLRKRAIPVVHGHNMEQVEYCVKAYSDLDVQQIGFGSFGTGGKGNGVNTLNTHALSSLTLLSSWLTQHKIRVHAFGVGTPPVIYLLNKAGVFSFDSVGWMKTAGYGKIYMPFVRAYNVTYRDPTARGMTREVFEDIKARTGHECYFCHSFSRLSEERDMRMMHNLTVILDTLEQLDQTKTVDELLEAHSPRYAKLNQEFENDT